MAERFGGEIGAVSRLSEVGLLEMVLRMPWDFEVVFGGVVVLVLGLGFVVSGCVVLGIVGLALDGDGLLALLEAHPCDLVITDLMMPGS
ncbi:hypothetical protein ACPTGW_28635, partial [Pseudomonas aeruginosa]